LWWDQRILSQDYAQLNCQVMSLMVSSSIAGLDLLRVSSATRGCMSSAGMFVVVRSEEGRKEINWEVNEKTKYCWLFSRVPTSESMKGSGGNRLSEGCGGVNKKIVFRRTPQSATRSSQSSLSSRDATTLIFRQLVPALKVSVSLRQLINIKRAYPPFWSRAC
jgi:hypothetical protein